MKIQFIFNINGNASLHGSFTEKIYIDKKTFINIEKNTRLSIKEKYIRISLFQGLDLGKLEQSN